MGVLAVKLRRDVRRQRGQFLAIMVTIFLGVALFGATYDAYRNLVVSYETAFTEYRFANLTVDGGRTGAIAEALRAREDVAAVATRVEADVPLEVEGRELLGRVVGLPAGRQPSVNRVEVQAGRLPSGGSRGVLAEQHLADAFDLRPGDSLLARGPGGELRLEVTGVAASPEYFWPARSRQDLLPGSREFGVVFAPDRLAERIAGLDGPNQIVAYYRGGDPDAAATPALARVAERLGATGVQTRAEQPSNSALQQDVRAFEELAILFPLLFLTAAALATGVLMRRMVTAQRPIVGMLRACGYTRTQVVGHYLAFGALAGAVGGALGAAAGLLLASAVTDAYTSELSIPVSLTELRPSTWLAGAGFGLATGLVAAGLPAWSAAQTPPAEAMRRFAPLGGGSASLVERLIPPLRRLPVTWLVSLRSIGRNRRRSLSTALGVVLALTLILVSWGMVDTTQILVDRQFDRIERQDAQLYLGGPLGRETLERVRSTPGVARAEPALEAPVSLRANGRSYRTSLIGLERGTRMHEFLLRGGGTTTLPADGLLAGKALAGELDVGPSGRVLVRATTGGLSRRVPVEAFLDEPLGTYVYARLGAIRAVAGTGVGLGNSVLVRYGPGVDREAMRERLSAIPGVDAFQDAEVLAREVDRYLGLFYLFVGVMLAFGGAMAFALLFNSMSSNIAERSVEVATLRAAGMPFRTLARMIAAENALVTLAGIVPGLIVGYLAAGVFMDSFSSDQFSFELQLRPSTPVLAALAIALVALLSQRPGLRLLRRLDIARVVRERAG